ncbi:hypothetical protein WJX82_005540 [Trebouxia sp. C0006]
MGKQLAAAITKYNNEDPSASIQVIHKDVPTKLKEGMGDSIKAAAGSSRTRRSDTGLGMVNKLGPKTGGRVKEGQRVVAVPWPTAGGEGMYQQYVAVPEKDLVVVPSNVDDDMAAQFLIR